MDIIEFIPIQYNFLDKQSHSKLLKFVKNDIEYQPQTITAKGETKFVKYELDEGIRKVSGCFINNSPHNIEKDEPSPKTKIFWYNYLVYKFTSFLDRFCENNELFHRPKDLDMDIVILKYEDNGHYQAHTDYGKFTPRQISFSYILNDDYEGGEFEFVLPKKRSMKIKPKENSCIMFPSNFMFPHKVHPVPKGTRYVIVGWMP